MRSSGKYMNRGYETTEGRLIVIEPPAANLRANPLKPYRDAAKGKHERAASSPTLTMSEHRGICAGVSAGKRKVEVEDTDFSYGLYADGVKVASSAEGRMGYPEWARRSRHLEYASTALPKRHREFIVLWYSSAVVLRTKGDVEDQYA